jgi:vancomycin permeability regulator SanA
VGRDGRVFEIENWGTSNIFRQGKQENLLVADNQTRQYDRAEDGEKKYLTEVAWGKDHTQASNHC